VSDAAHETSRLPVGDDGLLVEGIVARQLAQHPIGPRPGRRGNSVTFNRLARNSALTMYLVELQPGEHKCAHRHLDETLTYVVSGEGWSEFRQDDDHPGTRFTWRTGDLYATPANAWHEHANSHADRPARLLSFKNAPVLARLLGGSPSTHATWRLRDRYADEPDYFDTIVEQPDGRRAAGRVRDVAAVAMPPEDPRFGDGVAAQDYVMGGHRCILSTIVAVRAGGLVGPHRPDAEEALVVLSGQGATDLWAADGSVHTLSWEAGDLISVPYGVWRQHRAGTPDDVRLLQVRNAFVTVGMGLHPGIHSVPDRFPTTITTGGDPAPAP
jgi:quercetin dioxygenase-like cupin family protein